jgi:hypothetical protein
MKEVILISSHLNNIQKEREALETIKFLKRHFSYDIVFVGNYPMSQDVQREADYVFYTKDNPACSDRLTFGWQSFLGFDKITNYKFHAFAHDYGFAHLYQIAQGMWLCESLGYEKVYHFNYDIPLDIKEISKVIAKGQKAWAENKVGYFIDVADQLQNDLKSNGIWDGKENMVFPSTSVVAFASLTKMFNKVWVETLRPYYTDTMFNPIIHPYTNFDDMPSRPVWVFEHFMGYFINPMVESGILNFDTDCWKSTRGRLNWGHGHDESIMRNHGFQPDNNQIWVVLKAGTKVEKVKIGETFIEDFIIDKSTSNHEVAVLIDFSSDYLGKNLAINDITLFRIDEHYKAYRPIWHLEDKTDKGWLFNNYNPTPRIVY